MASILMLLLMLKTIVGKLCAKLGWVEFIDRLFGKFNGSGSEEKQVFEGFNSKI